MATEIVPVVGVALDAGLNQFSGDRCRIGSPSGTMNDDDMTQLKQFVPAMPGRQRGKCVGAQQQNQRAIRPKFVAQTLQRRHCETGAIGFHLRVVGDEARVAGDGKTNHRQAVPGGNERAFAVGRLTGREETNLRERKGLGGLLGESQMTEMNRVEGAAENA